MLTAANNRARKKKEINLFVFMSQGSDMQKERLLSQCKSNMIFIHNFNVTCTDGRYNVQANGKRQSTTSFYLLSLTVH